MMGITGAFSSLGINERSRIPQDNLFATKSPKNCSLPNLVLTDRSTFLQNVCDDDIETSEQPVDFSKKYCETKSMKTEESCTFNNVVKNYNNSFTMYAETDLDQPTDYSLRYAEDDSDSDRCGKLQKSETAEFVQDTIKTYCTEDTPYETPFNFSTSTSMSDLRLDKDTKLENESKNNLTRVKETSDSHRNKLKSGFSSGLMSPEKPINYCEEGTPGYFSRVASCGSLNYLTVSDPPKQEESKEIPENNKRELKKVGKFSSETKAVKFEDVVNYAEETPLMFSRSSSLASLDSIEQHSIHDDRSSVVSDFSRLTSGVISPSELPDSPSQTIPPSPKPRKNCMVFPPILKKKTEDISQNVQNMPKSSIFEDIVKKFKTESTPLEFSTATSLSSLLDDEVDSKVKNETEIIKSEKNLDLSEDSEDENILAACINIGMQNNRYSQPKAVDNEISTSFQFTQRDSESVLPKSDITGDSLRTYCTEDTPAALSQAGSNSNLVTALDENGKNNLQDSQEEHNGDTGGQEEAPSHNPEQDEKEDSRQSSISILSDNSDESDTELLEKCILAGMSKNVKSIVETQPIIQEEIKITESESSDEDDADILASCINMGMKNNRYTQPHKLASIDDNNDIIVTDSIKSYFTEDTPAVLSNAGSCSNLSVLHVQDSDDGVIKDYLSDLNSNFSDEDDERLLEECIRSGMAAISGKLQNKSSSDGNTTNLDKKKETKKDKTKDHNNYLVEAITSDSSTCFSGSDSETDEALLEQCILSGMPTQQTSKKHQQIAANILTPARKAFHQECILDGMKKYQKLNTKKGNDEETTELAENEEALLRQCILSGMSKNKLTTIHARQSSSNLHESTELTQSERLLLQQCILAGMPKSKNAISKRDSGVLNNKKGIWRKGQEGERNEQHTCCIHCPKNNPRKQQNAHARSRRRYREKDLFEGRETRDVNILYVTSQIVVKKEVIDRSREKWV